MKDIGNFHPANPQFGKAKLKEIINPPPKKKNPKDLCHILAYSISRNKI